LTLLRIVQGKTKKQTTMKHRSTVILSAIITLLVFAGITYTSCKRDRCKGANCLNGGACVDGQCICRDGYSGLSCEIKNKSTVVYYNKTFTKVIVVVGGTAKMLDTGASISFTGDVGDSIKGTATTQGQYGNKVTLQNLSYVFPPRGTVGQDIDVPAEYFFLKVINNNPSIVARKVYVNYGVAADETLDITEIPNDQQPHSIGYYKAKATTKIHIENYPQVWKFDSLGLPMTKNQLYTAILN
jgi:hypothetical protein